MRYQEIPTPSVQYSGRSRIMGNAFEIALLDTLDQVGKRSGIKAPCSALIGDQPHNPDTHVTHLTPLTIHANNNNTQVTKIDVAIAPALTLV